MNGEPRRMKNEHGLIVPGEGEPASVLEMTWALTWVLLRVALVIAIWLILLIGLFGGLFTVPLIVLLGFIAVWSLVALRKTLPRLLARRRERRDARKR